MAENTPLVVTTPRVTDPAIQAEHHRRAELRGAFGDDAFGRLAEKAARFFGTPQYIVGQTVAVVAWVVVNSSQLHLGFAWDVYPFIALNLLFSLRLPMRRRSSSSPRRVRRTATNFIWTKSTRSTAAWSVRPRRKRTSCSRCCNRIPT